MRVAAVVVGAVGAGRVVGVEGWRGCRGVSGGEDEEVGEGGEAAELQPPLVGEVQEADEVERDRDVRRVAPGGGRVE